MTRKFTINRWGVGRFVPATAVIAAAIIAFANQNPGQTIPLSSIVATNPQAEMRYLKDVFPSGEGEEYQKKFLTSETNASNIFLVDAINERKAISASVRVLFGPMSANTATNTKGRNHWLVAYLGSGPSNPRWFVVDDVSINRDKIRLAYSTPKVSNVTDDIQRYYYWVPLGKLKAGIYFVELYDANVKSVVLSRRVTVESNSE